MSVSSKYTLSGIPTITSSINLLLQFEEHYICTMSGIRQEKIASLLKREIATVFQRETNTWFNGRFITITQVRMSPDLTLAKVYISIMISKDKKADLEMVRSNTWQIKNRVANNAGKHLRRMPDLNFYIDDSLDYYEDIDRLLKD